MYHALAHSTQQEGVIDFEALMRHASTPNGMNEQAVKEVRREGAHEAYKMAADNLLKRFKSNL